MKYLDYIMNNIPQIRFPEFVNDKSWNEKSIEQISPSIFDGTHQTPVYTTEGIPFFSVENLISGNKNKFISLGDHTIATNKNKPEKGDILITRIGNIGFSKIIDWDYEFSIYVTLAVIKQSKEFNSYYLHSFFQSNYYQKEIRSKSLLSAAPCKINMNELRTTLVLVPPSLQEQQKIADCLSSLDEVIIGHEEKLKGLQKHKKGLMQNLFPQEGEKSPKYRFPEFADNGDWKEIELGKCLTRQPEYGINAPAVPFSNELPTYLRITDISVDGQFLSNERVSVDKPVTENNYLSEGDIVLARTGASVGKSYKYRSIDGKLVFAGFLIRVKPDESKLNSEFLFQYLSTNQYWKWVSFISARSGQPGINGTEYSSMPISLPPSKGEQQKIASCLSSLDELITEQINRIAQLKLHKKGLMQGLFPKIEE